MYLAQVRATTLTTTNGSSEGGCKICDSLVRPEQRRRRGKKRWRWASGHESRRKLPRSASRVHVADQFGKWPPAADTCTSSQAVFTWWSFVYIGEWGSATQLWKVNFASSLVVPRRSSRTKLIEIYDRFGGVNLAFN